MEWTRVKILLTALSDYFFLHHTLQGEDGYFTQLGKAAEQDFENHFAGGTLVFGQVV